MSSPKGARLVPQPENTKPEEVMHISSFVLATKGKQVLLIRRSRPEQTAGSWVLPSAVINWGEDPGSAALRIIQEQLGVMPTAMKLLDVQSFGDKHWDMCFLFQVEAPSPMNLGPDFDKSEYFDLSKLPPELREGNKEVLEMARSRKAI